MFGRVRVGGEHHAMVTGQLAESCRGKFTIGSTLAARKNWLGAKKSGRNFFYFFKYILCNGTRASCDGDRATRRVLLRKIYDRVNVGSWKNFGKVQKNPTETFFIFSKNNRKQVQSSSGAMDALPIVSPNGKWLRCGEKLVAIRCIKYIDPFHGNRLRITLASVDSEIFYTRSMTFDETDQVLRTLYG